MRNIVTSALAALALSVGVASVASASPINDGNEARLTKVLTDASRGNLVIGVEGPRNDGNRASLGLIVDDNHLTQAASVSDEETRGE